MSKTKPTKEEELSQLVNLLNSADNGVRISLLDKNGREAKSIYADEIQAFLTDNELKGSILNHIKSLL